MQVGDPIMFRTYPSPICSGDVMLIDNDTIVVRITSYYRKGALEIINKKSVLSAEEVKAMKIQNLRKTLSRWVDDTTDEGVFKATELLRGLMNE